MGLMYTNTETKKMRMYAIRGITRSFPTRRSTEQTNQPRGLETGTVVELLLEARQIYFICGKATALTNILEISAQICTND